MRTIKFRAWDSVNNRMVYDLTDHYPLKHYLERAEDGEIMQFTGFTDAGKSDLYEGDTIENDGVFYKIEWSKHNGCWDAINVASSENIALSELASSKETWLQGNVFENSESA